MSVQSDIDQSAHFFIGEDREFDYTVRDVAGNIVDISGWSLEWVMRATAAANAAVIAKTTTAGITIPTGTDGVAKVTILDADTYDDTGSAIVIQPSTYTYVLRRTGPGEDVVLAYGKVVLQLGASR